MVVFPAYNPEKVWTGNNHSAFRAKHPAGFIQKMNGIFDMLQHIECPHRLKGLIGKRNPVAVVNLASVRMRFRKVDAGFRDVDSMRAKTLIFEGLNNLSDAAPDIQKGMVRGTVGRKASTILGIECLGTAQGRQGLMPPWVRITEIF